MLLTFLSVFTYFRFKCWIERGKKFVETLSLGTLALGFSGGIRETSKIWQVSQQLWFFTSNFSSIFTLLLRLTGKKFSLYLGSIAVVSKNKLLSWRFLHELLLMNTKLYTIIQNIMLRFYVKWFKQFNKKAN